MWAGLGHGQSNPLIPIKSRVLLWTDRGQSACREGAEVLVWDTECSRHKYRAPQICHRLLPLRMSWCFCFSFRLSITLFLLTSSILFSGLRRISYWKINSRQTTTTKNKTKCGTCARRSPGRGSISCTETERVWLQPFCACPVYPPVRFKSPEQMIIINTNICNKNALKEWKPDAKATIRQVQE